MLTIIFGTIGGITGLVSIFFNQKDINLRIKKELFKANVYRNWSCLLGIIAISCLLIAVIA